MTQKMGHPALSPMAQKGRAPGPAPAPKGRDSICNPDGSEGYALIVMGFSSLSGPK